MPNYKLLTPGPLTTTDTVKKEMLFDHCTWDDDYKKITLSIREKLLNLAHVSEPEYTVVLMQGSGTFGVESVLTSVIGEEDTLLIAANGAYGERMGDIARHAGIHYLMYEEDYNKIPSAEKIREILAEHPEPALAGWISRWGIWKLISSSAAPTNASRAYPDSPLLSATEKSSWKAKEKPEACLWISMTSGRP